MGGKPRVAAGGKVVAFLRGMNLGKRRITNVELCAAFEELGFANVTAFLASGNVIFDARRGGAELETEVADGLARLLDYPVPTFVRSAEEVRAISAHVPFDAAAMASTTGNIQVMLLSERPSPAARSKALKHHSADDRLTVIERAIYWLPRGNMSASELDIKAIESAVGSVTIRTKRTIDRIAANYL